MNEYAVKDLMSVDDIMGEIRRRKLGGAYLAKFNDKLKR